MRIYWLIKQHPSMNFSNQIVLVFATAFFMLIMSINIVFAQETSYEIILDTYLDERPQKFVRNDNGGFVGLVLKAPPSDSVYIYNTYLYEVDSNGDTVSVKLVKQDTTVNFYNLYRINTVPKGYLLTGKGYSVNNNPSQPIVIIRRIDLGFNLVWERAFTFSQFNLEITLSSILELDNGDLLYACSPFFDPGMFILKLSSDGDSLDFESYHGNQAGKVIDLSYNHDSTQVLLSTMYAYYINGDKLASVISIDENLDQISYNFYPSNFVFPYNVMYLNNESLLVGGSDRIPNSQTGMYDKMICAYLLDTSFNIQHEIHLTNPDTNSRAAEVQGLDFYYPNHIYLGGNHNLQNFTGYEPSWFYIAKLNDTLGLEYEKYIGGDYYYWLYSVTASTDGGVLLAGTRNDYTTNYLQRDGILLKLDSTGCITQNLENLDLRISEAVVYPNPGIECINVRTGLKDCNFILFDSFGRIFMADPLTQHISTFSTKSLPSGSYHYVVKQKKKIVISGTWIKN